MTYTVDLNRLTPRQRLIVTLHYFEGWTLPEIAFALKSSVEGVRNCNTRALRTLEETSTLPLRGRWRRSTYRGYVDL